MKDDPVHLVPAKDDALRIAPSKQHGQPPDTPCQQPWRITGLTNNGDRR